MAALGQEGVDLAKNDLDRRSGSRRCPRRTRRQTRSGRVVHSTKQGIRERRRRTQPFDLVSVAWSKGLGCPVGSVLAGERVTIARAARARRMFGGAMRQSGILAAAGLYALDHNVARLTEDHASARLIAEWLAGVSGLMLDLATVQSNIVIFRLEDQLPDAATIAAGAREAGVLVSALGPRTVRAVTHLDVTAEQCRVAADRLANIIEAR